MQLISTLTIALAAAATASGSRSSPVRARQEGGGGSPVAAYAPCGGFTPHPVECEYGFQCIQDPRITGGPTDQPGICVPDDWAQCAGFRGLECLPGWGPSVCYDWPNDDCDPQNGGADCIGICLYPL
ncbi:hypothetical protein SLS62_010571 [Diatrype stigma]|uniref:Uncharacterized protein n=1 Tax=Diatrype stigma TaxID=117547 RepID=A0AAN9UB45_9PEZI